MQKKTVTVKKSYKRGYRNYEDLDKIEDKFDLIISLHSLEHLTDLKIFDKFKKLTKKILIFL